MSSAVAAAVAEPVEFTRREWHQLDGLNSEEIKQVVQDRAGYLWVGTTTGLARFDGMHFYHVDLPENSDGRSSQVLALADSPTLGLLVATHTGGVWMLGREAAAQPVPFADALEGQVVLALFVEPSGTIWAARADEVVVRYDGRETQSFRIPSRLVGARWIGFATDRAQRLWVVSGADLMRYEAGELRPYPLSLDNAELRIASSRGEGPWLITANQLLRMTGDTLQPMAALPPLLGAHYVQAAVEDADGAVWLGTRSRGLHRVAGGDVSALPGAHDDIYALLADREGSLWVGANGAGLHRVRRQTYRIYDKRIGLLSDFSTTVCEDRDGAMWFANRDGGVVRVRGSELTRFPNLPGWPSYSAVSVFPRPEGGVGFSCAPGLYRVGAPGEDAIQRIEAVPVLPIVRDTFVARNGDTWISVGPDQVGRLRAGEFRTFGEAAGFPKDEVRSLAEDPSGRILVGTLGGRLLRFDGERFAEVDLPVSRIRRAIHAILVEPDGRVWLGTEGDGLKVLDDVGVHTIGLREGLPHGDVAQIIADDLGFLWFGSRGGIFRVSRRELLACARGEVDRVHSILLGKDDGLTGISCLGMYQPGAWKSRDGRLWFATRRGVLAIDPSAQAAAPAPPPIEIVRVRHDGVVVARQAEAAVAAAVRKIEIDFSVLCLSTPERVQASYRLEGFDDDWVLAGQQHTATYPRLPPGTYTFRVQAGIGDGATNEEGATLAFVVARPWWQTGWFRIATFLALVLSVAGAVRAWSHRRLRRRLEKLQRESAIERERTRIAQNIHDDVGASLTRISLLTQSAQKAPGGAPQFEQIYETVTDITRAMDEIVWAVNPNYDDLDSLGYYVGNYAQSFLNAAGIRCRLDIPGQLPSVTLTSQTRHHLFLCCKEALNNVAKHAAASVVTVRIAIEGDELVISVSDDGRGLHAGESVPPPGRVAFGQGLTNLQRRMAEVGGTCEIAPDAAGGTRATFRVRIGTLEKAKS